MKDKIPGGLADNKTPEDVAEKHGVSLQLILDQLTKGIKVEMEHTDQEEIAREIALDHLLEIPDYYDKLAPIENPEEIEEGKKERKKKKDADAEFAAQHVANTGHATIELGTSESKLNRFDDFEQIEEDGEMATPDSVPGMGAPVLASRGVVGSGDIPLGINPKKKKNKIKRFNEYFKK